MPIKGEKAPDVGCGTGISTFALEELGFDIVGIDIREETIQKAKEIAKRRRSKAKFYFMDAKRLEFEHESFDLVALLVLPCHILVFMSLTK